MSDTDKRKTIHFLVTGRVQGVFFRGSSMEQARALGLSGWVRNLPDGQVESVASGNDDSLAEFASWLQEGPPAAIVESVIQEIVTSDIVESLPFPFETRH